MIHNYDCFATRLKEKKREKQNLLLLNFYDHNQLEDIETIWGLQSNRSLPLLGRAIVNNDLYNTHNKADIVIS